MLVRVSAPGKSILMGEHAAVYGRPAIVAAIDRRLAVEIAPRPGREVRLVLPQVGVDTTCGWPEIRRYATAARRRWEGYAARPGAAAFAHLRGDDPAHLVKVALGEAAASLGEGEAPGLELRLASQIPLGAGFGSSAAAAVAVVAAYLFLRDAEPTPDELRRLALEVERRQHGNPSGVDGATVLLGGLVWARRSAAGALAVEPLAADAPSLSAIRVFNTGTPNEPTGSVVAAVGERLAADATLEGVLGRMEEATRALRTALAADDAPRRMVALLREFESCLEALGVVPPAVREVVRAVEARGGAAKISGAGALSGTGAGSLLVYHPDPAEVDRWTFLAPLERLDLRLGAEGLRREA